MFYPESISSPDGGQQQLPMPPAPPPGFMAIEKCICELCECGDHRCPHAGTLGVPSAEERFARHHRIGPSEYGQAFLPKTTFPAESFRPPVSSPPNRRSLPALDMESTHQHDFRPWLCETPPMVHGAPGADAEQLLRPMEPFTARTTHQVDFDKKPIPAENMVRQCSSAGAPPRPSPRIPFFGESVHHADFVPKPLDPAKPFRPSEADHRQGTLPPLDSETTHGHDFRHFEKAEPAKPFRPPSGSSRHFDGADEHRTKFQDITEHRANFGPKSAQLSASFRPKSTEWRPNNQKMATRSEYQEGFGPISNVEKLEPIRPPENRHIQQKNSGPFTAKTTHQVDFTPKPPPPERLCLAERVLTHRDHSYQFAGIRSGHRYYRRFQATRPGPMQKMRLAPVQG